MQRLYYSIADISKIVDEEPYVLRYWEREFEILTPKKNRGGHRVYSEKDLLIIKFIQKLLREEKLTINGAKDRIKKLIQKFDKDKLLSSIEKYLETSKEKFLTLQFENNKEYKAKSDLEEEKVFISKQDLNELYILLKNVLNILKEDN